MFRSIIWGMKKYNLKKVYLLLILTLGMAIFGYKTLFSTDQSTGKNHTTPTSTQSAYPSSKSIATSFPTTALPSPTPTLFPAITIAVPKEIESGNSLKKQVILTFDAGSGKDSLDVILKLLEKYNIKASFFLTGKWIEQNTKDVKQIAENGHEIFNHTYSHPDLTKLSDAQIKEELQKTEELVIKYIQTTSKPYFRPPYGARNSNVLKIAAGEGYASVYWTIDAWDWRENEGVTPEQVKLRVYDNLKPGSIYLFHVGSKTTGIVLEEIITQIRSFGYDIVPLSKGL